MYNQAMSCSIHDTYSEFVQNYTLRIRSYILARNSENSITLDPDDFVQEVLLKFKRENTLNKYNPDRGASFDTWFYRILYNFFCTAFRKKEEENRRVFDLPEDYEETTADHNRNFIDENYLETMDDCLCTSDDDLKFILELVENISAVRERLSIKLKAYPYMNLNDEDLNFMAQNAGISRKKLTDELEWIYATKPGKRAGLRDEDVAKLLGYSSFTTQRKRAVRKYIIPQYVYMKSRKE